MIFKWYFYENILSIFNKFLGFPKFIIFKQKIVAKTATITLNKHKHINWKYI